MRHELAGLAYVSYRIDGGCISFGLVSGFGTVW